MASPDNYDELISTLVDPSFVDTIKLGLVLQDADMSIVEVNQAATEVLGRSYEDLIGHSGHDIVGDAVHEDGSDFPEDELPWRVALETGEPIQGTVMGFDAPRAHRRWVVIDTFPICKDGVATGVLSSFNDQTARINSERLFRLLAAVNQLVIDAKTEDQFYTDLVPLLAQGHDSVGVSLVLDDGSTYVNGERLPVEVVGLESTRGEPSLVTRVLHSAEDFIDNDVSAGEDTPWRRALREIEGAALLIVPIDLGDKRAALCAVSVRPRVFSHDTVNGFLAVMREIEFGVRHVRSLDQLQRALLGTLDALSVMTESRDPYTVGHQSRVAALSRRICERLGLDEELVQLVTLAAEVHDVGKIAVPVEILTRPGRLAPVEMDIVREHVRVGYEILSRAQLPWPIAEVALQHHERLDGSGYPQNLVGEDIILPARIVAVADVVEAVTQSRPYRLGLGVDRALQILTDGSGTQFDPEVVEACQAEFAEGFSFQ